MSRTRASLTVSEPLFGSRFVNPERHIKHMCSVGITSVFGASFLNRQFMSTIKHVPAQQPFDIVHLPSQGSDKSYKPMKKDTDKKHLSQKYNQMKPQLTKSKYYTNSMRLYGRKVPEQTFNIIDTPYELEILQNNKANICKSIDSKDNNGNEEYSRRDTLKKKELQTSFQKKQATTQFQTTLNGTKKLLQKKLYSMSSYQVAVLSRRKTTSKLYDRPLKNYTDKIKRSAHRVPKESCAPWNVQDYDTTPTEGWK